MQIKEKIDYVQQYYTIKKNDGLKGYNAIATELDVPKSCLLEWIQEYDYLKLVKGSSTKFNLEGAGRIPATIAIEEDLIKWIEEQRRPEIAINTNEIPYKWSYSRAGVIAEIPQLFILK